MLLKNIQVLSNNTIRKFDSEKGEAFEVVITDKEKQEIIKNFRAGAPFITVDHKDITQGDTGAYGYVEKLYLDSQGDLRSDISLNAQGEDIYNNEKYRRMSVYFRPNENGEAELISISFTNDPADRDQELIKILNSENLQYNNKKTKMIYAFSSSVPIVEGTQTSPKKQGTKEEESEKQKNKTGGNMTPEEIKALQDENAALKQQIAEMQAKMDEAAKKETEAALAAEADKKAKEAEAAALAAEADKKAKEQAAALAAETEKKNKTIAALAAAAGVTDSDSADEIAKKMFALSSRGQHLSSGAGDKTPVKSTGTVIC